jgi:hypothetical protein
VAVSYETLERIATRDEAWADALEELVAWSESMDEPDGLARPNPALDDED